MDKSNVGILLWKFRYLTYSLIKGEGHYSLMKYDSLAINSLCDLEISHLTPLSLIFSSCKDRDYHLCDGHHYNSFLFSHFPVGVALWHSSEWKDTDISVCSWRAIISWHGHQLSPLSFFFFPLEWRCNGWSSSHPATLKEKLRE